MSAWMRRHPVWGELIAIVLSSPIMGLILAGIDRLDSGRLNYSWQTYALVGLVFQAVISVAQKLGDLVAWLIRRWHRSPLDGPQS